MAEYTKPWLSLEQQVERLRSRGVDVGDRDHAAAVLRAVGYYRLTGYLYAFRESEQYIDEERPHAHSCPRWLQDRNDAVSRPGHHRL